MDNNGQLCDHKNEISMRYSVLKVNSMQIPACLENCTNKISEKSIEYSIGLAINVQALNFSIVRIDEHRGSWIASIVIVPIHLLLIFHLKTNLSIASFDYTLFLLFLYFSMNRTFNAKS
jgi:hypothetical protein